jgi:hypothetical protein
MRVIRRVFVVGALGALVAAFVPSASAQTPTVTSVIGAADGLSANIDVELPIPPASAEDGGVGALDTLSIGPIPTVTLPPEGGSVSDEVISFSETVGDLGIDVVELQADLLRTTAEGALGPDGFATAETTVADLLLGEILIEDDQVGAQQLLDPILSAQAIIATCSADLDGVSGSTTLVDANVLGILDLEEEPAPNTEILDIEIPQVASAAVILNRQVENPDGSLSVTALVLEVTVGDIITASLEIGPATCGVTEGVIPADVVVPAPPTPIEVTPRFTG